MLEAERYFGGSVDRKEIRFDDRRRSMDDGFETARWRTPIRSRQLDPAGVLFPREAEAWPDTDEGSWCYARFTARAVETMD